LHYFQVKTAATETMYNVQYCCKSKANWNKNDKIKIQLIQSIKLNKKETQKWEMNQKER